MKEAICTKVWPDELKRYAKIQIGDKVYMKNKTRKGLEPRSTVKIRNEKEITYKRCTSQVKLAPMEAGEEGLRINEESVKE